MVMAEQQLALIIEARDKASANLRAVGGNMRSLEQQAMASATGSCPCPRPACRISVYAAGMRSVATSRASRTPTRQARICGTA